MTKQYNLEENGTIWYEENGFRISFLTDPSNPDYQIYLKHLTENPTEDVE
jgi:hypothetical protein